MIYVPQQRRTVFTPEIKEKWLQDDPLLEYVMYNIQVTVNLRFEQTLKTCSLIIIFALPQSWETACVKKTLPTLKALYTLCQTHVFAQPL